jgi:hypothetical protein
VDSSNSIYKGRSRSKSYDDLATVSLLDAADRRAQDAMRLVEKEAKRREELEAKLSQVVLPKTHPISNAENTPEKPISVSPQGLTVRGSHWKIMIPFTFVVAAIPLIWTLVLDYQELHSQIKLQRNLCTELQQKVDSLEKSIAETNKYNNETREAVAKLSGYIAAIPPSTKTVTPDPYSKGMKRP